MGCYYRRNVVCSRSHEYCWNCGWNPEEERRRKEKLMSGEVKTYLHITPDTYKTLLMRNIREGMKDDD